MPRKSATTILTPSEHRGNPPPQSCLRLSNCARNRLTILLDCEPINRYIRLMTYNWQLPDWPEFRYELGGVAEALLAFADHAGRVDGLLEGLPEDLGTEAVLDLMIAEAIRSSAIEGETLNRDAVMSSIRNRLGLNAVPQRVDSRMADGAGELVVAVRNGFREPLFQTLFWHRMLPAAPPAFGSAAGGWAATRCRSCFPAGSTGQTVHFKPRPPSGSPPK